VDFQTLGVRQEGAVWFVHISAPPMNLLGTELVRDLVSLIQRAESDDACHVLVFASADRDYFISHVDVTRIGEYRKEAEKLAGEASLGLLFRYLSTSRLVTIAQIEGRVRGAGSEFVLACDMRFAARESAIFSQPELGFGLIPGVGSIGWGCGTPMLCDVSHGFTSFFVLTRSAGLGFHFLNHGPSSLTVFRAPHLTRQVRSGIVLPARNRPTTVSPAAPMS